MAKKILSLQKLSANGGGDDSGRNSNLSIFICDDGQGSSLSLYVCTSLGNF